ncbi:hypothetical protein ABXS75_02765 [Roseburia hominis]
MKTVKSWSGSTSGRYISGYAAETGHHKGLIRNASSYAITVTGAVFDFE